MGFCKSSPIADESAQCTISCKCGQTKIKISEAGPRMTYECCCIDCCQRLDWCEAKEAPFTHPRTIGGAWHGVFGNSIVDVTGQENMKVLIIRLFS